MTGDNVQEFSQLEPKDVFEGEEFRTGFDVEGDSGGEGEVRMGLGHLVAALAPKGEPLGRGCGKASPGCV